jgi:formate dehydrogenase assembly factor FdhD
VGEDEKIMACSCGDDVRKKMFCSAGHPELLPAGYYYREGYLYKPDGTRTTKAEGEQLAKEMSERETQ